jgi:hypothetical protein
MLEVIFNTPFFVFRLVCKIMKSFVMPVCSPVCPSVLKKQLGTHNTDFFYQIWYLRIFLKSVKKFQVSLKLDSHDGYSTWISYLYLLRYLAEFLIEWEMFQTNFVEKIKTHSLSSITFFSKIVTFMRKCGKIWDSRACHRRQYNMAYAQCMLDK